MYCEKVIVKLFLVTGYYSRIGGQLSIVAESSFSTVTESYFHHAFCVAWLCNIYTCRIGVTLMSVRSAVVTPLYFFEQNFVTGNLKWNAD